MTPFLFLSIFLFVLLGVLPVVLVIGHYNGLVTLRNHIRESWSNVDTELKRRHELIPNLVAVVRGYAGHERAVLERVVELRSLAEKITGVAERSERERALGDGLAGLLAVAEHYPDLKADAHFLRLQEELVRTEDRIQAARRFYNGNVRDYQNRRESFPGNLVALLFQFSPLGYFEAGPAVQQAPSVGPF